MTTERGSTQDALDVAYLLARSNSLWTAYAAALHKTLTLLVSLPPQARAKMTHEEIKAHVRSEIDALVPLFRAQLADIEKRRDSGDTLYQTEALRVYASSQIQQAEQTVL